MSDQLREAIEYLTTGQGSANLAMADLPEPVWDALAVWLDAARKWLAVEEAEPIQWCEVHRSSKHYPLSILCDLKLRELHFPEDERPLEVRGSCRIVPKLLVSTEGET